MGKVVEMKSQKVATPADKYSQNWDFFLDHVHPWAYWEKAFSPDECEAIIEYGNSIGLSTAETFGDTGSKSRKSDVAWLGADSNISWVFERVRNIVVDLNDQFFKFDITGMNEGMQFTRYVAPSGFYGKHVDSNIGARIRKLSFVLQLSDANDYDGGELVVHHDAVPSVMRKEQGYVTVFPSYSLHEVKPVTSGTRYSLVSWITGPAFK